MTILLVEDDDILAFALEKALTKSGYVVCHASDGNSARQLWQHHLPDLVLLDLGLPQRDGLSLLQLMRQEGMTTPVMILTARDGLDDRVTGLDGGADDYLIKPFAIDELFARIRALLRRSPASHPRLQFSDLIWDPQTRTAYIQGEILALTPREAQILEAMLTNPRRSISKERLIALFNSWDKNPGTNAVEVTVFRLRRKLADFGISIETVRSFGYALRMQDDTTFP